MMLSEGTGFGHLYSNLFGGRMPDYTNSTDNLTLFQKLHLQLAEIIEKTPAGEKLKSEPELAASLGVSRATLREAMRSFEGQGLIRRRQGVGTFVLDQKQNIESGLEILESIETQANRLGMDVKMGYLGISRENAGGLRLSPPAACCQSHLNMAAFLFISEADKTCLIFPYFTF